MVPSDQRGDGVLGCVDGLQKVTLRLMESLVLFHAHLFGLIKCLLISVLFLLRGLAFRLELVDLCQGLAKGGLKFTDPGFCQVTAAPGAARAKSDIDTRTIAARVAPCFLGV